jgi:hypothetical protein
MWVETTLSLVTLVFGLHKLFPQATHTFAARLAHHVARFKRRRARKRFLLPDASPFQRLHIAHFSF